MVMIERSCFSGSVNAHLDSLTDALVELIMEIEAAFQVTISDDEAEQMTTPEEVQVYLIGVTAGSRRFSCWYLLIASDRTGVR